MNERIKLLRRELNLTQEEFARKISLTRSGLSNIERGTVSLTIRNIKTICKIFKVNENWLRYGKGEMFCELQDDKELLNFIINVMADKDEFVKKTFVTLARLDQEEWDLIKKIINQLKEG